MKVFSGVEAKLSNVSETTVRSEQKAVLNRGKTVVSRSATAADDLGPFHTLLTEQSTAVTGEWLLGGAANVQCWPPLLLLLSLSIIFTHFCYYY